MRNPKLSGLSLKVCTAETEVCYLDVGELVILKLVHDDAVIIKGFPGLHFAEGGIVGMAVGMAVFVLCNHLLVGVVIKVARGQSFAESGVFELYTLVLDFTILSMGAVTVLIWTYNPLASLLNLLPLYLLYNAIRVPALARRVEELEKQMAVSGD